MMPDGMIDWIKAESKRTGASQAEIIRRAVHEYRVSRSYAEEVHHGPRKARRISANT